jgi:ribosomal protein L11 methyltransferase
MPRSRFLRVTELVLRCKDAPAANALLKELFVSLGIPAEKLIESRTNSRFSVAAYGLPAAKAKSLAQRIRDQRLKGVGIHLKVLRPKDWERRWREDFRPFRLTRKFDIVPRWRQKEYRRNKRSAIIIDTVTAFGTGQHETTRFMVELIERCEGKFESFLDIGTGTGILSIAAFRCGAKKVAAIDIDPAVMDVARKNLHVNGYGFHELRTAGLRAFRTRKQYDFVAANLVTTKLLEGANNLVSLVKPGKFLAVSGISLENVKALQKAYRRLPLRCLKVRRGRQWAAVLYQKYSSHSRVPIKNNLGKSARKRESLNINIF